MKTNNYILVNKINIVLILALIGFCFNNKANAQLTTLHTFTNTGNDGSHPYYGSLYSDSTFLYGMTGEGGAHGFGTIFKIKPDGSNYTDLYDFGNGPDGGGPWGTLIPEGIYLYGMTAGGGVGYGTIFKIKPDGTGYETLFYFASVADGRIPYGHLFSDGTFLYGTTAQGGRFDQGTLFKIKLDGTNYTKLVNFGGGANGSFPVGSLISDDTFLYGTTGTGGAYNNGTIFRIKFDGTGDTTLFSFNNVNGNQPMCTLASDGTFLYGMTLTGGAYNAGTIFKIKPNGTNFDTLLSFSPTATGGYPDGSLIYDGSFLYGMTAGGGAFNGGTIFRIKIDGTDYTKLSDFNHVNGSSPFGSLISDGSYLYGMTHDGGANTDGVIFKLGLETIGVTEINIESLIKIFPNPGNGIFTIIADRTEQSQIEIYNLLGEIVYQSLIPQLSNSPINIDLTAKPKGIYIVRIEQNNKILTTRKLVITD